MKQIEEEKISCQVAVVGGGMSGICAAMASARKGVDTILIQDRPVLGGNASSEIRMHICGADIHGSRPNARETGILEELLLENKYYNPEHSYALFDMVLWGKVSHEPNLRLFLNTYMTDVEATEHTVHSIHAVQLTSERRFEFSAEMFVDATGDGTLGALAGAEYMYGREGKQVFEEEIAPDESDHCTMGSSLMFTARDMGRPVDYRKPQWAYSFDETSLENRDHHQISSGYWWIELGGNTEHIIHDAEPIRDELVKSVAGVWDHIKNDQGHHAENYLMDWMGFLPGKRESRRLLGDYVLTANDCLESRIFEDTVAYGGWNIDNHVVSGLLDHAQEPTCYTHTKDVYTIPYRCLYSQNIDNLFLAGRAISCSHLAFASSRVMGTCAVVGQASGTAAAMAVKNNCTPRTIGENISCLQQELIRDGCFLPGFENQSSLTIGQSCRISASSYQDGFGPEEIATGQYRANKTRSHCWKSDGISPEGEWLEVRFEKPVSVSEARITFDSNLSREITISISEEVLARQHKGTPEELVKDYDLEWFCQGKLVSKQTIRDNYQRLNVLKYAQPILCDQVKITCYRTWGCKDAAVFGLDVYEK